MDDNWTAPADAHITEFGEGYTETYGEWRLRQWREDADAHVEAWKQSEAYTKRPFRFEDLNGRPEPASWGPVYPKLASLEKWRKLERKRELTGDETRAYGAAVGEAIRKLNRPPKSGPISLKCTVENTCGTCNTAAGEAERYRHWVEVRLPAIRAERLAREAMREAA